MSGAADVPRCDFASEAEVVCDCGWFGRGFDLARASSEVSGEAGPQVCPSCARAVGVSLLAVALELDAPQAVTDEPASDKLRFGVNDPDPETYLTRLRAAQADGDVPRSVWTGPPKIGVGPGVRAVRERTTTTGGGRVTTETKVKKKVPACQVEVRRPRWVDKVSPHSGSWQGMVQSGTYRAPCGVKPVVNPKAPEAEWVCAEHQPKEVQPVLSLAERVAAQTAERQRQQDEALAAFAANQQEVERRLDEVQVAVRALVKGLAFDVRVRRHVEETSGGAEWSFYTDPADPEWNEDATLEVLVDIRPGYRDGPVFYVAASRYTHEHHGPYRSLEAAADKLAAVLAAAVRLQAPPARPVDDPTPPIRGRSAVSNSASRPRRRFNFTE